jgi:hypothetical protein
VQQGGDEVQAIPYYGLLAVESLVGVFGVRLYEEPHYAIVDQLGSVEIRSYVPRVAAAVDFSTRGEAERGDAFRLLFAYISGANTGNGARIAMTAPVELHDNERVANERLAMTAPVQTSASRMMFFLPAEYSLATAPSALDPRVKIVAVPGQKIAVLRFSGLGFDSRQRQKQLVSKVSRSKWRPVGDSFMLYYDAPFTLPFLRRNEAAVVVEEMS